MRTTKYWFHAITTSNWDIETSRGHFLLGISDRWKGLHKALSEEDHIIFYIMTKSSRKDPRVKRIPGIFRVSSNPYVDSTPQWPDSVYPLRAKLEPVLLALEAEHMLSIEPLIHRLSFIKNKAYWGRVFQTALVQIPKTDFELIKRELVKTIDTQIAVPRTPTETTFKPTHTSVEWALVFMGKHSGYETWITGSDRKKKHAGSPIGVGSLQELPDLGVGANVKAIVRHIDVLWLRRNKVVAAFEVEHSTTIQSGLTRLNDLVIAAPNLSINLYVVAPDQRRSKLERELGRPSFEELQAKVRFIPYSKIIQKLNAAQRIIELGGSLTDVFLIQEAETVSVG